MTGRAVLALVALLWANLPAAAQDLTIALSTQEVRITSNFTGTEVTLFGVIAGDPAPPEGGYAVAVTLRGPSQNVAVRRKDRVVGVWINRASKTVLAMPAFYALRTSTPLSDIGDAELLRRNFLGTANLAFVYRDSLMINDPDGEEFRQAFLRLKQEGGLYSEAVDVTFLGDQVFRTTIALPANVAVGAYRAEVRVFADGSLLALERENLVVARSGGERLLFDFSRTQSILYGLASVALALFVGWAGGVIFRRD